LYQLFPFFPHRGGARLLSTTQAPTQAAAALLHFASVIALVPVIDVLCSAARSKRLALAAMVMLVPVKVFIFTRELTMVELVSTGAAFAVALLLRIRTRVAAVV